MLLAGFTYNTFLPLCHNSGTSIRQVSVGGRPLQPLLDRQQQRGRGRGRRRDEGAASRRRELQAVHAVALLHGRGAAAGGVDLHSEETQPAAAAAVVAALARHGFSAVSQAAGPGVVAVVATVGALPGHGVAINRPAESAPRPLPRMASRGEGDGWRPVCPQEHRPRRAGQRGW